MKRKKWLAKKRTLEEKKEKINGNKEEIRRGAIEVIPDKTREAVKKGLVITNIY